MISTMRYGTLALFVTVVSCWMPAKCDAATGLFGCPSCGPSVSYYAPAYVAPAYVAPTTYVANYPSYVPVATTRAYAPVVTYRPFLGTYRTRLVPYTTYYPSYSTYYQTAYAPVVPYVSYSPCASCVSPCSSCVSPCSTCVSSCATGSCGASYSWPASGCSSCATPVSCGVSSGCSSCAVSGSSNAGTVPEAAPQRKTFQESNKPVTESGEGPSMATPPASDLQPIPQGGTASPETKVNPTAVPQQNDPKERTAARPIRQVNHVELISLSTQRVSENEKAGWRVSQ
jgi:hypothetical protein